MHGRPSMSPRLPRATPESRGVSPAAIAEFVRDLDLLGGTHSYMVLRDGAVIAEGWWAPYSAARGHSMYSVSKSFASVAVGIAVDEGRLTLGDRVVELLSDAAPDSIGPALGAMQVRHLLTMTTGHGADTIDLAHLARNGNWARAILAAEVSHTPGTVFVYNSGATYLLSAIISQLTGERLIDYLQPRLLEPLGIVGATWEQSPTGVDAGGWGLKITTEDLATFGELCRRGGDWEGVQLVPAGWIEEATGVRVPTDRPESSEDWRQGYGYQFWRCRHGAYRADGAFGQFAVVIPKTRMVVAITSGVPTSAATLELIWRHLLPGSSSATDVAAPGPSKLELPTPAGDGYAGSADLEMHFDALAGDALVRRFSLDGSPLRIADLVGEYTVSIGHGRWCPGQVLHRGREVPVAAAAAWADEATWVARVWITDSPFCIILAVLVADAGVLRLDIELNAAFGPTQIARLCGRQTVGGTNGRGTTQDGPRTADDAEWTLRVRIGADGGIDAHLRANTDSLARPQGDVRNLRHTAR